MDRDKVVYYYWGDGEEIPNVPRRDLTAGDMDYLDAGNRAMILNTEIVRWDGNKQKRYRLYNKTARPSTMATDLYPSDPEKAEAALAEQAAKDAEKAAEDERAEPSADTET